MREIKFRAWNTVGKKMHPDSDWVYEWRMIKEQHESGLIVLLQYTGLKDVNGVDIYEGDIIKTAGHNIKVESKPSISVKYGHGDCGFSASTNWFGFYGKGDDIEVIGNIYENPELLK